MEAKQFYFAQCLRILKAVIYLFLFKVARMSSKLLSSHWILIEMVNLSHIHRASWIVLIYVTVTTLQANHITLFPEMFSDPFVRVSVFWSAKALVLIALAISLLNMPFQLCYSEYFDFLKTRTSMANFYLINNVLQDFWLNVSESLRILTLAEEADHSISLLCRWAIVACQTTIANYFSTVSALFRVDWNRHTCSAP